MLASVPASMVNQKPTDLGIPNRFKLNSSRFRLAFAHDQHASAIIVAADPLTGANNREFVERRISLKLPAIHTFPFEAKSGALISYGIDIEENYLRIAEYADRLLKAQKIADLPFQNPRG